MRPDCSRSVTFQRQDICGECTGSGAKRGTSPAMCKQCRGKGVTTIRQGFLNIRQNCPGCGGYWLDAGEMEKIRAETGETTRHNEARAAGQLQLTAPVLRYIYQMRTGERM